MAPNESVIIDNASNCEWSPSRELERLALEQLGESKETRESGLAALRRWIGEDPTLANCRTDRVFLLRFLRSQKFNLDKTKTVLRNYLDMRRENPDWFTGLDPTEEYVEEMCHSGFSIVLPERDRQGRRVLFSYVTKIDLSKHQNSHVVRTMMCAVETLMEDEENQIRGIAYVFYCKGISFSHLSIWTPADAARLFGTCEKNLGIRHTDINLVKLPFTMWAVVEFVKQFLSAKIKSRINVFSDLSKLAEKLGDSPILPLDADGISATSLECMGRSWRKELLGHRKSLLDLDKMTSTKTTSTTS